MYKKELDSALKAAFLARTAILEVYNSPDLGVEIKEDNSPVTKADKAADRIIRECLSKNFPNYAMLTEESIDNKNRLENDYVWIVDPVDGTKDFVARNGEFTVNIGLSYKHEVVLGVVLAPVSGDVYFATKGDGSFYLKNGETTPVRIHCSDKTTDMKVLMSRFHVSQEEKDLVKKYADRISKEETIGAALKGCMIASGKAELNYRTSSNTKEWDTAAMQCIVEEAGGFILKFDGTPIKYNREDVYNHGGYMICNKKENFLI